MKKIIFLIISSCENEDKYTNYYKDMKNILPTYMDLFSDQIEYFFVEYKSDLEDEIIVVKNNIYIKGNESMVPGIYNKTLKGFEYIYNNYDYEYIIRTNLSTIWHIPNLLNLLSTKSKTNYFGGILLFNWFIRGTGIIMSKDVSKILFEHYKCENSTISDDVLMTQNIQNANISLDCFPDTHILNLSSEILLYSNSVDNIKIDNISFDNTIYIRIKNFRSLEGKNYDYDPNLMKNVINKIYK